MPFVAPVVSTYDESSSDWDSENECLSSMFAVKKQAHNMSCRSSSSSENSVFTVKPEQNVVTRSLKAKHEKEVQQATPAAQEELSNPCEQ